MAFNTSTLYRFRRSRLATTWWISTGVARFLRDNVDYMADKEGSPLASIPYDSLKNIHADWRDTLIEMLDAFGINYEQHPTRSIYIVVWVIMRKKDAKACLSSTMNPCPIVPFTSLVCYRIQATLPPLETFMMRMPLSSGYTAAVIWDGPLAIDQSTMILDQCYLKEFPIYSIR